MTSTITTAIIQKSTQTTSSDISNCRKVAVKSEVRRIVGATRNLKPEQEIDYGKSIIQSLSALQEAAGQ